MADISRVAVSEKHSGRPRTMPLDNLWNRLEAFFAAQEAKSSSKQKFTVAVFLRHCVTLDEIRCSSAGLFSKLNMRLCGEGALLY
jgi:hypothetical protein